MKIKVDERVGLFKYRNKDGKITYRISLFYDGFGKLLGRFKTNREARHAMHEDIKKSSKCS